MLDTKFFIDSLRDSRVIGCTFVQDRFAIIMEDFDGYVWDICICTNHLQYSPSVFDSAVGVQGKVYELVKELEVSSGLYVPPKDISTLSLHARLGLSLAYGRRASKFKHLVCFANSEPLISCLVKNMTEISIAEQN